MKNEKKDLWLIPCAVFIPFIFLGLTGVKISGWTSYIPFFVSFFTIGMAHGAADLPKLFCNCRSRNGAKYIKHLLVYSAILITSVTLSIVFDYRYLIFFALLTAYHFGISDKLVKFGIPLWDNFYGLARGIFIVSLPFFLKPYESYEFVTTLMNILGSKIVMNEELWLSSSIPIILTSISLAFVVTILRIGSFSQPGFSSLKEICELTCVFLIFEFHTPVFAVGMYFLFVHSLRDVLKESVITSSIALKKEFKSILGIGKENLFILIPTWLLYTLVIIVLGIPISFENLLALRIIFYAVLTPAHQFYRTITSGPVSLPH